VDALKLVQALDLFSVLDPTHLYAHQVQILLVVAQHEPCTLKTIEDRLNLSNSAVSRTIKAFGPVNRKGHPGFDLIATHPDPGEGRRFLVTLTSKGKALIRQLNTI